MNKFKRGDIVVTVRQRPMIVDGMYLTIGGVETYLCHVLTRKGHRHRTAKKRHIAAKDLTALEE